MANYNQLSGGLGQINYGNDPYNLFGVSQGNAQRNQLSSNIGNMSQFGGQLGNLYMNNQAGINGTIGGLQAIANGQNSVSAMQLQQGLQQAQAQQMSSAASANPQAGPAAARTAMMQMGQQASGEMGQQAVAGLQERNNAYGQLANLQLGQSGQNLNGALGALNGANQATGTYLQNQAPSWWQQYGKSAANGLASGLGAAF
jgi:hypothetical protein